MRVYILRKSEFHCDKMDKFKRQLIATGAISVAIVSGYITIRVDQEHKEFPVPSVTVTSKSGQSNTIEQQLNNQIYDKNYKWDVKDNKLIRKCSDSEFNVRGEVYVIQDTAHDIYTYPWPAINFLPLKNSSESYIRFSLGDVESDYSSENGLLIDYVDEANKNCSNLGLSFKIRK